MSFNNSSKNNFLTMKEVNSSKTNNEIRVLEKEKEAQQEGDIYQEVYEMKKEPGFYNKMKEKLFYRRYRRSCVNRTRYAKLKNNSEKHTVRTMLRTQFDGQNHRPVSFLEIL